MRSFWEEHVEQEEEEEDITFESDGDEESIEKKSCKITDFVLVAVRVGSTMLSSLHLSYSGYHYALTEMMYKMGPIWARISS